MTSRLTIDHGRFIDAVSRLSLRFPVADIAERTGAQKGNVSGYLNNKKTISESFLDAFFAAYGRDLARLGISKKDMYESAGLPAPAEQLVKQQAEEIRTLRGELKRLHVTLRLLLQHIDNKKPGDLSPG